MKTATSDRGIVPLLAYDCYPVVGGPKHGATFTPLWDVERGQHVRLEPPVPREWRNQYAGSDPGGFYRVSFDGKRVEWVKS